VKTPERVEWAVVEEADGVSFRWGYAEEDLVAEWPGILTLRATRSGELKALRPAPGASDDLVEKTRLGVATAFLRAQRRQHALHASAVAWQGNALVCVGPSGLGKSTMAERMCLRPGVELVADDTATIEFVPDGQVHVVPSESAIWLAKEGSGAKEPMRPSRAAQHPAALRYVVSLVFDAAAPSLELRHLRGGDAVSALLPSLVRFEKTSALWARELDFLSELVKHGRVVQARRSYDVPADAVADALVDLLTGEAP
jgi:hypothetical protein